VPLSSLGVKLSSFLFSFADSSPSYLKGRLSGTIRAIRPRDGSTFIKILLRTVTTYLNKPTLSIIGEIEEGNIELFNDKDLSRILTSYLFFFFKKKRIFLNSIYRLYPTFFSLLKLAHFRTHPHKSFHSPAFPTKELYPAFHIQPNPFATFG
jgi:hypothetical protein